MGATNTDRTTNKLIQGAFTLCGKFANDKNLSGPNFSQGLEVLNSLLDFYSASSDLIGYYKTIEFPLVISQKEYIISRDISLNPDVIFDQCILPLHVQLNLSSVRYPVEIVPDIYDYNISRYDNVTTIPWRVYFQNSPGATTLDFIVFPSSDFTCKLKGKFALTYLEENENITTLPNYYHLFLKFALGRMLSKHYIGSAWPPENEAMYKELLDSVTSANDMSLAANTGASLKTRWNDNYYNGCRYY